MDLDFVAGSPVVVVCNRSAGYRTLFELSRKELVHKLATGEDYVFTKEKMKSSLLYLELFGLVQQHGPSNTFKLTARTRELIDKLSHDNREFMLYQNGHLEPVDDD